MKIVFALAVLAFGMAQACRDTREDCAAMKSVGYCNLPSYRPFMKKWCSLTCNFCGGPPQPPTQGPPQPPTQGPPQPPTQGPPQPPTQGPGPDPDTQCGQPEVQMSRVISGTAAARGSWPWQILMMKNGRAGCGGTLISSRWVVTAAHCVDRSENSPWSFTVRVGEHDRRTKEGSEQDIQVEKVVKHPGWGRNMRNDIALFKLSKPVQFTKWVKPACLPSRNPADGTECYITGWGKMTHPGSMTMGPLQQALLPVVSNSVCHAKNYRSIRVAVTDDMICGGDGGKTRKSGCHGDSGGPFVCNINGKWELHGDVSHGSNDCNSSKTYTVFARTFYFKSWIQEQMQRYGN